MWAVGPDFSAGRSYDLELRIQQELPVPFRALDGRLNNVIRHGAQTLNRLAHLGHCAGVRCLVTYDATLAHELAPRERRAQTL